MSASYKNSFWSSRSLDPKVYTTDAKPCEYRGFLIYHRIRSTSKGGDCFDVVKRDVCIGQYAGLSGAKSLIDKIKDTPKDFWAVRAMDQLKKARAQA